MKLPEPPTDNIYKFIAITGLGLVLYSLLIMFYFESKYENLAILNTADSKLSRVKMDEIKSRLTAENKFTHENPSIEFTAEFEASWKNKKQFELAMRDVAIARVYGRDAMYIGILMFFFGMMLWYLRVQVPLDRQLKNLTINSERIV